MKKILIIEDDEDIAEIITLALAGKYIVKARTDNKELLEILRDFQPDLVMLDYYIGQKKAHEIVEEMRNGAVNKDLPFILFSGHQDIQRLAYEMGASAWLAKPFNLSDLYSTIKKVLPTQTLP
jgi:DNA-binding response OmpR family regulator